MKATQTKLDIVIIGAGLAGGLLALRLKSKTPSLRILVVEKKARGTFAKTWSCHDSDLEATPWARVVMTRSWSGYDVRFPKRNRSLSTRYHSLVPADFHDKLATALGENLRFETEVASRTEDSVSLRDGTIFHADAVIDSSLPLEWSSERCGFQKFVGHHVRLSRPHGLKNPILMDATVPQLDGFRFFYVLPFSETELLIEDTRFSETEAIEREDYDREIAAYALEAGWTIAETTATEVGVLPLPFAPASQTRSGVAAEIGMSAGFFHVVTGYSLPDAVRVAEKLASLPRLTTSSAKATLADHARERAHGRRYLYLLNRMMFRAALPAERYRIFERFYGLSESLIGRFYRDELTTADRVRILVGRPPVPVSKAVKCFFNEATST